MKKSAWKTLALNLSILAAMSWTATLAGTRGDQLSLQKREPMSITVTFPLGGESLNQDGQCLIKWTFKGNPGPTVNIYLIQGTVRAKVLALNLPLTNRQFLWRIDKNMKLADNYSILVQSAEHPAAMGKSNAFRIVLSSLSVKPGSGAATVYTPPQVTVVKPEQGTNWAAGDPQEIKWHYTGTPPGQAKVLLMKNNQVIKTISDAEYWGQGGTGYIIPYYMPSDTPPGSGYTIKVVSTTDDKYRGSSGQFTITPYANLNVTQPDSNAPVANWPVGSVHTLTWTYTATCGAHVKIQLHGGVNDNWNVYTIVASWPIGSNGSGSFQWTVPPSGTNGINWIPGNQYQMTVVGLENAKCWDWTGKFTVSQ